MARALTDIITELKTNFVSNLTLQACYGLTPGNTFDDEFSKVSFENVLIGIVAFSIWTLEKIFDDQRVWMENRAETIKTGNLYWYEQRALEFQLGDALVFLDGIYQYNPVIEANRVVNLASATESGVNVILKTAKYDVANNIIPLTNTELTALMLYMKKRRFAGCSLTVASRPADELKIYYKVYYDPLVLAADGSLLTDSSIFPVEDSINEYSKGIVFDGVFDCTQLTDSLQKTQGVVNPVFQNASAKFGLGSYVPIIDYYNPNAGYLKIDPAYPLNTTITYIAN